MKTFATALVLFASTTAFSTSAFAMGEELSMLELATTNAFQQLNVENVDVMSLTVSQLAQIRGVLESDISDNDKKRRIEAIATN
ncbi:hypothetical protein ACW9UR_19650 [Halovulum sp. GXIMD14794]